MDETDIMKHDQLNGARRQKGYDYLKRPVGKRNVIIQNKTSINSTLDDRGEEQVCHVQCLILDWGAWPRSVSRSFSQTGVRVWFKEGTLVGHSGLSLS